MFDAIWFGMKALPKILLALTAVAALSLAYPASVQAVPTTYQYTGNPFTFVIGPLHHERLRDGNGDVGGPPGTRTSMAPSHPRLLHFPMACRQSRISLPSSLVFPFRDRAHRPDHRLGHHSGQRSFTRLYIHNRTLETSRRHRRRGIDVRTPRRNGSIETSRGYGKTGRQ